MEEESPRDLQSVMQKLLSNPELVETLKKEVFGQTESAESKEDAEQEKARETENNGKEERDGKADAKRREQLLCALKPYLSPGRARAVDTVVNLSRILDSVKTTRKE